VQFIVPAGSYIMRVVVREPGGLVGSADRRIDVRPLDGPEVAVSDLVLGSALAGLPVRPRAYTGDGLSGLLEAYGRTDVQLEGLHVTLELRRPDGGRVAALKAELQAPEEDTDGMRRRANFLLPLENVAPGDYIAHAIVSARGEVVAERTRQVEVLDGRAPAAAPTESRPAPLQAVSPVEVTRGDLAQKYIQSLLRRADGTSAYMAARRASEGKWEEAELELRRITGETSMTAEALRGFALFAREQYAAAAEALDRAFEAEPRNALTAFFLGWAREGAGDAPGALSAWRSAAHLDPSLVSVHLALADGYLRMSQPALAAQALRAGLLAIPASPELQGKLEQIEARKDK
jgi:tetratricopeptide (TPR) repeat protein